jgi:PAS domain S-box-containing protein
MKTSEASRSRAWIALVLLAAGVVTAGCFYALGGQLWQVGVLIGLLLFGAGACAGLLWRQHRTGQVAAQENKNLRLFATVVKDSNDAITIQDFHGGINAWNRGAEVMYGYSEAEALAMNIERLTAPGKVAEQQDFIRRLVEGEAVTSFETQRVTKDGRVLDVWMTVTKLLDDAGKPSGLASTERDITARKRAEENSRRMAAVMRDSHDAITLQDFEGKITAWNFGAKNIYGYTETEALAKNIESLTTPEKVREQADFIRRLVAGEPVNSFETQRVTKDGRVLDVWLTLTKILDDGGNPIGLASTERDITARKRAEETLKTSEERFRTAAENLMDVVYDWDIKEKLEWYGDIDEIMGYPVGEFPRTIAAWAGAVHPEDKERVQAALEEHLKVAAPFDVKYRVRRRDGEWRWWSGRGTALRDPRGEPYKMVGSITDITERKQAAEKMEKQLDELRRWHEVTLGRETRVIALKHEVNGLLTRLGETSRYASESSGP